MRKAIILLLTVAVVGPAPAFAQGEVHKVGTTAANFLNLEVGARAVALAGAFTALANDASTLKWNPAGLSFFDRLTVTYHNVNLYADIKHQFVGVVIPAGSNNVFGVALDYVDLGKIEKTTVESPDGTGLFFISYDMAVSLSYSRMLTDRVTFGVTGRYVHEQIWQEKADGYCGDLGLLFTPGLSGLRVGMSITNFGPNMAMDEGPLQTFSYEPRPDQPGVGNRNLDAKFMVDDYPMPISFQMGMVLDLVGPNAFLAKSPSNRLTWVFEVNDAFDNPMRAKYGLEYEWRRTLALRAGYKQKYDLATFSFGGGLRLPLGGMNVSFDYALADYGDLGSVHVTSVEIGF